MSDILKDREQSYEAKMKLDEETKFKAEARRNKLVGLWVAEKMGLSGDDAIAYAKEVIDADFEEPGPEDVVRKVMADCASRGVDLTETELRAEMDRFYARAIEEIKNAYPDPLGSDHSKVGD